jgi:drug/metabolite transporter superfamily protein YnfA
VTTLWLILALLASLAGNAILWRAWRQAERMAAGEARKAALEAVTILNDEIKDAADANSQVNAATRGGASDVLERLRKSGSP